MESWKLVYGLGLGTLLAGVILAAGGALSMMRGDLTPLSASVLVAQGVAGLSVAALTLRALIRSFSSRVGRTTT